jgi:isoleucyl-tRNA synthetase
VKQLADGYRKVRNTARYLLGNLHDFNPATDSVPVAELPLLDRWILTRTATVINDVSDDFNNYEFYRFFQSLLNFCVRDLSSFYLDIAKDRLYVSGANDFRRRSCQTVLHLVIERLASMIAPVLCHMAEDIWQNLPYEVKEDSVFERGWPTAPDEWNASISFENFWAVNDVRDWLRPAVNRLLESQRKDGRIGSSLEACVILDGDVAGEPLKRLLNAIAESRHSDVDNLKDWLLVSQLSVGQIVGWQPDTLVEAKESGLVIKIAKAEGEKCDRCWHYERDVVDHTLNKAVTGRICGRCRGILETETHAAD